MVFKEGNKEVAVYNYMEDSLCLDTFYLAYVLKLCVMNEYIQTYLTLLYLCCGMSSEHINKI